MPRNRKTITELKLNGSLARNPGRYSDRLNEPTPQLEVGTAPASLNDAEKAIWYELCNDVSWLAVTDRLALEMACRLTNKMRTDPDFKASSMASLTALVRTLGMTPSDRTKMSIPPEKEEDEWTKLLS